LYLRRKISLFSLQKCFIIFSSVLLAAFYFMSCADPAPTEKEEILVGTKPSSIRQGESYNVELKTKEPFFVENIKTETPIVSDGGLILKKITVIDKENAIATLVSDEETQTGLHTFRLIGKNNEAFMDITVFPPDAGPGEVIAERNEGSSGADFAFFTIYGEGTHFDQYCRAEVSGASGFTLRNLSVESPTKIDVYYNIDIDQEPTEIVITLIDGDYHYDVPFNIVRHKEFENEIEGQFLTRGQVGEIFWSHRDASYTKYTELLDVETGIEYGTAIETDEGVRIPVRIPYDFEYDSVSFLARTFTGIGSYLELTQCDVSIVDPAFIALKESKLSPAPGEQERNFVTHGISVDQLADIWIEDELHNVEVKDWQRERENEGRIYIDISEEAAEGGYNLMAKSNIKQEFASALAVSDWFSMNAYVAKRTIADGDRVYLPVTVQGGDLAENSVSIETDDDVEILDQFYIDRFSVVLDVAVAKNAFPSTREITVSGEKYNYLVLLQISESGV
jgi:hypothetical protein